MTGFLFSDVCLIFCFPVEVLFSFLSEEAFIKLWVSHQYTGFNMIFLLPLSVLRSQISYIGAVQTMQGGLHSHCKWTQSIQVTEPS